MKINKFCAFAWQFATASGLQSDQAGPFSHAARRAGEEQEIGSGEFLSPLTPYRPRTPPGTAGDEEDPLAEFLSQNPNVGKPYRPPTPPGTAGDEEVSGSAEASNIAERRSDYDSFLPEARDVPTGGHDVPADKDSFVPHLSVLDFVPKAADEKTSFEDHVAATKHIPPDAEDETSMLDGIVAGFGARIHVPEDVPTSLKDVLAEAEAKKSKLLPWGYDADTKKLKKTSKIV